MDEGMIQQIVDELLSSFEPLETQSAALLQFLKAKGIATDEQLAPFLEQAGNAANVRWRAVRVRTAALISSAMKPSEKPIETSDAKPAQQHKAAESSAASDQQEAQKKGEKRQQEENKSQKEKAAGEKEQAQDNKEQTRKRDFAEKQTKTPPQPSQQSGEDSKPATPESASPENSDKAKEKVA